jgi:ParB family transcriptional regulator, chromosome partitioning protein
MTPTTLSMDKLFFGHEYPGANINSRIAGRDAEIERLAASIVAEGLLQPLLVCPGPDDGAYYVIDGNRRLAACRKVLADGNPLPVIIRDDVTPTDALRVSLASNEHVPMHPVDRFEAFAAVHAAEIAAGADEAAAVAEIARHYATTEIKVRRSLALGRLSANVREAWRSGKIDQQTAQAFTLAADQDQQDEVLARLSEKHTLTPYAIRAQLIGNDHIPKKLAFVGIEAYEAAGGTVIRDLFEGRHGVSDPVLLQKMVDDKLAQICRDLVAYGWKWAETFGAVGMESYSWNRVDAEPRYEPGEKERLDEIDATLDINLDIEEDELSALRDEAQRIEAAAHLRGISAERKASSGCVVDIDSDGNLDIEYGYIRPDGKKVRAAAGKDNAEPVGLSVALQQRLVEQCLNAVRDALAEVAKTTDPLTKELIKITLTVLGKNSDLKPLLDSLPSNAIDTALKANFDAEDYLKHCGATLRLAAIVEALPKDAVERASKFVGAKLTEFALANVPKTGWLPDGFRPAHYANPLAAAKTTPEKKTPAKPKAKAPAKPKAKKTTAKKPTQTKKA